jgi:hypothetical protein
MQIDLDLLSLNATPLAVPLPRGWAQYTVNLLAALSGHGSARSWWRAARSTRISWPGRSTWRLTRQISLYSIELMGVGTGRYQSSLMTRAGRRQ